MKPEKEEKKDREMCEKRKEKMIIEIALLVINWITPEYSDIFGKRFWENCKMPVTLIESSFVAVLLNIKNPQKRFWESKFCFWERIWGDFWEVLLCRKRTTKDDV